MLRGVWTAPGVLDVRVTQSLHWLMLTIQLTCGHGHEKRSVSLHASNNAFGIQVTQFYYLKPTQNKHNFTLFKFHTSSPAISFLRNVTYVSNRI